MRREVNPLSGSKKPRDCGACMTVACSSSANSRRMFSRGAVPGSAYPRGKLYCSARRAWRYCFSRMNFSALMAAMTTPFPAVSRTRSKG